MAKIGLQKFRFGVLTENATTGAATYGPAQTPGKAISCSVEVENNDASLYADDVLQESDTSFAGGTVTMGIDREDQATMATLLGHTVDNGVMVRSSEDVAPYVGLGRIVTVLRDNVRKYKVEFLSKVKFSEPSQDDTTKGESVEFNTYELEGTIAALASGEWSKTQIFDDEDDALNYLTGLFGTASA